MPIKGERVNPLGHWPRPGLLTIALVVLAVSLAIATPLGVGAAQIQSTLPAEEPVFVPRVDIGPCPDKCPDVLGVVLDRNGRGLPGVWVRVTSEGGWEARTATRGDGSFYFTLTEGKFSVVLIDRVSQPAFFRVDGKTAIRIVFQEVASGATPTPVNPTPQPTLAPSTSTPPPGATLTPPRPRGTPTPSVTPLSPLVPSPTPSGSSPPGLPGIDPWLSTFLAGIGLGAALFLGALIVLRRRH